MNLFPALKEEEEGKEFDKQGTMNSEKSREKTMESIKQSETSRQASDVKAPSTPRGPTKPIKKLISRPPPPPQPKARSPPPPPPQRVELATPERKPSRQRTPSPMPVVTIQKRPITPIPGFISQFQDMDWFEKFFPKCNEKVKTLGVNLLSCHGLVS